MIADGGAERNPRTFDEPGALRSYARMSRSALAATLVALTAAQVAHAQARPFASYRRLTSANGWAPLVYDVESRRVTVFRENMYRFPAPGQETRDLAYDLYLGLRAGGRGGWLSEVALDEVGYEPGTNLVRTVQRSEGLRVTTTYYAPYDLPARAFVVVAEVVAERDVTDATLYSLHNFHLGSGPDATVGERIGRRGAALVETGVGPGALVILPLTPAAHATASPENPYGLVNAGRPFADVLPAGPVDDGVSGFQFDVGSLARGATAHIALAVAWAPSGDAAGTIAQLEAWQARRAPPELLTAARAEWAAWLRRGHLPVTQADEAAVALQSMAILRMGQVTESGGPNGQMLASLPPGQWDIAWVRDGMLAVQALTETGHHEEAERALEFYIRGPVGEYRDYVGRDYGLSVCRYYGNGREESDSNARGPNVELDGFGLYLEAAAAHVQSAPTGPAWLTRHVDAVSRTIADVLVDTADRDTGLVMADSSIWESHWTDGGRQRWIYTSGTAVLGLRAWADVLAARDPADPRVARYRARADTVLAAIEAHLVDATTGALVASVEQRTRPDRAFADAQAALILGPRSIPAGSARGLATLQLLRDRLFLAGTTARGYKRNDDGDAYDEREWVVVDLGIARALRDAGRTSEADALIAWITGQATLNFGIVPELLDQTDGRYAGETPMIGFGAGAYLRALIHRSGTRPVDPPAADAGTTHDDATLDGGPSTPDADPAASEAGPPDAGTANADAATTSGADAGLAGSGDATRARDASAVDPSARGCGCATGPASTSAEGPALLLLALATAVRNVRGRRRRTSGA